MRATAVALFLSNSKNVEISVLSVF